MLTTSRQTNTSTFKQVNRQASPIITISQTSTIQQSNDEILKSSLLVVRPPQVKNNPDSQIIPTSSFAPTTSTSYPTTIAKNCEQNCFHIKIIVQDKTYNLQLKTGTTAYEAMDILQQNSDFTFNGQNYASLGFFVNEINGVKNDAKNNKYWIYYINGQSAKVGISNYKLINNDLIDWKYEESKF